MHKDLRKRLKYAKKIINEGLKNPFYKLVTKQTDLGVRSILLYGKESVPLSMKPGYYTIYRRVGGKMECLYVGKSDHSIQQRINRWAKGIAGKLRPDESHAAATKARKDGVRLSDKIFVKIMSMDEVNRIVEDDDIRGEPLDEWIAPLLKSKYNENTFVLGASLEDFF
jgi:hypothetical protein